MTEATLMACPSLRHASEQPCSDNCAVHYIVKAVNAHAALVAALTLIAYRYESGDIGDLVNDMPEIEAALGAVK